MFWLISGILALLCVVELRAVMNPERHRNLIYRWAIQTRKVFGVNEVELARALPGMAYLLSVVWIGMTVSHLYSEVGLPWTLGRTLSLALIFIYLSVVLVLAVLMLAVLRTGRPRFMVMRPIRGASEREVRAWLVAETEGPRET